MQKHPVVFSERNFLSRNSVSLTGTIFIEKSGAHVWDILTTPGHLELVHPFCKFHKKVAWDTVGQEDSGEFYSGEKMNRKLIYINKGVSYTMELTGRKQKKTTTTFHIKENKESSGIDFSVSLITGAFNKMPRPFWKIYIQKKVEYNLESYLSSLLNGIKFYSETGIPVTKNQFGSLKSVSP